MTLSAAPDSQPQKLDASTLSAVYNSLIAVTAQKGLPQRLTQFHSKAEPAIGVEQYVKRIFDFFKCSDSCHVLALVYIDRLVKHRPEIAISSLSIHRMLAAATVVGAKYHDDEFYSNAYYAKVCGLSLKELNRLEYSFANLLRWQLFVSGQEFDAYFSQIFQAMTPTQPTGVHEKDNSSFSRGISGGSAKFGRSDSCKASSSASTASGTSEADDFPDTCKSSSTTPSNGCTRRHESPRRHDPFGTGGWTMCVTPTQLENLQAEIALKQNQARQLSVRLQSRGGCAPEIRAHYEQVREQLLEEVRVMEASLLEAAKNCASADVPEHVA